MLRLNACAGQMSPLQRSRGDLVERIFQSHNQGWGKDVVVSDMVYRGDNFSKI